jgi:Flp pilus assembly pilin Flp
MLKRPTTIDLLIRSEHGQTMAEYSVVLGAIVLGVLVALGTFATAVTAQLQNAASTIGSIVP